MQRELIGPCLWASLTVLTPMNPGAADPISFAPTIKTPAVWPLGRFQVALAKALAACKAKTLQVDFRLGKQTADAIAELRSCPAFKTDEPVTVAGSLTPLLWSRLMGNEQFPSVGDRARTLTFNYEGTDYTTFLWNVGEPADPSAWGTWGPFGATFAEGGEIQTILKGFAQTNSGSALLLHAFDEARSDGPVPHYSWRISYCAAHPASPPPAGGAQLLLQLHTPLSNSDKQALQGEFCSDERFSVWPRAFRLLGQSSGVRQAYDSHYSAQNRRITEPLAALYRRLGIPISEVDWAYFLDRATQYTTNLRLAENALRALPHTASPAERRLALSRSRRPTNAVQRKLRVGRDMAFIAPEGRNLMTSEEVADWEYAGQLTAKQFGLSDARLLPTNPF